MVKRLLEHGARSDVRDRLGRVPIHHAAGEGYATIIPILARSADEANAADNAGDTPLHMAAMNGRLAAARALLTAGANRCARNAQGRTPAEIASGAQSAGGQYALWAANDAGSLFGGLAEMAELLRA